MRALIVSISWLLREEAGKTKNTPLATAQQDWLSQHCELLNFFFFVCVCQDTVKSPRKKPGGSDMNG
jgi:hypothetical protein